MADVAKVITIIAHRQRASRRPPMRGAGGREDGSPDLGCSCVSMSALARRSDFSVPDNRGQSPSRSSVGGFDGIPLVAGVRWSFPGEDAGSVHIRRYGRTCVNRAELVGEQRGRRHRLYFAKPS